MKLIYPKKYMLALPWTTLRAGNLITAHTHRQIRRAIRFYTQIAQLRRELKADPIKFIKEHTFSQFMLANNELVVYNAMVLAKQFKKIEIGEYNRLNRTHITFNRSVDELIALLESMK